jgi:hypothetical protein
LALKGPDDPAAFRGTRCGTTGGSNLLAGSSGRGHRHGGVTGLDESKVLRFPVDSDDQLIPLAVKFKDFNGFLTRVSVGQPDSLLFLGIVNIEIINVLQLVHPAEFIGGALCRRGKGGACPGCPGGWKPGGRKGELVIKVGAVEAVSSARKGRDRINNPAKTVGNRSMRA